MRGSVTVHMAAPADRIWELVADVTRVGEFSPETFEAQWLGGATGPRPGARFRGHVRRDGKIYWTTCTVIVSEPGREFAFRADVAGRPFNTWRYRLEPTASGTEVTESFELAPAPLVRLFWALRGRVRGPSNLSGMRTTLERIRAVAEAGSGAGES